MKKKEKVQLAAIGVIVVIIILFLWRKGQGKEETERIWIARPESGTRKQTVLLQMEDTKEEYAFTVSSRARTTKETEEAFSETLCRLREVLGSDDDNSAVLTKSVSLPQFFSDLGTDIRWDSSEDTVLKKDGTLQREQLQESREITLRAYVSCEDETREYWFHIVVLPYDAESKEAQFYRAEQRLTEMERETARDDGFYLPEEVGTVTVGLPESSVSTAAVLAAAVLALPIVILFAKRQEREKAKRLREEELLAAYPRLITKLTLYTGAGLSLRGAWERLATEYRKEAESGGEKGALAEEVLLLAGELKNGTSERKAYEAFGRRIGLKPYLRCVSLLVSQLQKGSGAMREGLEQEAIQAWEMQRNRVTKKGEEAQTKLMFPMMGMLFLIMGVVMIPALFSM